MKAFLPLPGYHTRSYKVYLGSAFISPTYRRQELIHSLSTVSNTY